MDYSLAALKLFCCQLKDACQISSSPPSMTLQGIRFQRAWCQGVVISGSDDGVFLLDDGSDVVELSFHAESKIQEWKSGMYVMVVGLYMPGDSPLIKHTLLRLPLRMDELRLLRRLCDKIRKDKLKIVIFE